MLSMVCLKERKGTLVDISGKTRESDRSSQRWMTVRGSLGLRPRWQRKLRASLGRWHPITYSKFLPIQNYGKWMSYSALAKSAPLPAGRKQYLVHTRIMETILSKFDLLAFGWDATELQGLRFRWLQEWITPGLGGSKCPLTLPLLLQPEIRFLSRDTMAFYHRDSYANAVSANCQSSIEVVAAIVHYKQNVLPGPNGTRSYTIAAVVHYSCSTSLTTLSFRIFRRS